MTNGQRLQIGGKEYPRRKLINKEVNPPIYRHVGKSKNRSDPLHLTYLTFYMTQGGYAGFRQRNGIN